MKTFALIIALFAADVSAWEMVYAHDKNGNVTDGYKVDLIHAVKKGRDIKVRFLWTDPKNNAWAKIYTPVAVHMVNGEVYAECWALSGNMSLSPAGIDYYNWKGTAVFGTDGREVYKMFPPAGSGAPRFAMEWLVN